MVKKNEFFADGDYAGTPYRTLPARKKPLIQLGTEYYAIDPCFVRDAGYRALLFNLLQRKSDYKTRFLERQKIMSEAAFPDILAQQLPEAKVYQEVYYKDPVTKQWSENDTLVLIDDVLFLIEAKAGAAATIASPELDFKRHAQSVQDLFLKAYQQCQRFFNYLSSADEVPIHVRADGKYQECGRLRQSDYRVMIPIGLTVESFSPFSTFCKELPEVEPLLGNHAFLSLSIDDLFVLKRILPTPGIFAHYMEVRQAVAGLRRAHLFDEFDHLGAYIHKNRFDQDLIEQLKSGKENFVVWDGMSRIIDECFQGDDWEASPIPVQPFPDPLTKLLASLNSTRAPGWLLAESLIRNYSEQARQNLSNLLSNLAESLVQRPSRYFVFGGEGLPLFIWMQSAQSEADWNIIRDKASASALATASSKIHGLFVVIGRRCAYEIAEHFTAQAPTEKNEDNVTIFEEAARMSQQQKPPKPANSRSIQKRMKSKKIGRNQPCPCGSGLKYKKCHGR